MTGPLLIVSGPSGSGKSTVIARLRQTCDLPIHVSVSATTRTPRPGEEDGVHYDFWSAEHFREQLAAGAFLESACVHGHHYGTLRKEVEPYREQGIAVILDIDVQGAEQIRRIYPDAVSVFVRTPSPEAYEARLRSRGTDDEATIRRRVLGAARELARANEYDHQVVNEDLDTAVAELRAILEDQFERK